MELKKRIERKQ